MNKTYISLGVLAILLSFGIARAEIGASPQNQSACCEPVFYEIGLLNHLDTAQVFEISAEAEEGDIKVTLQPDAIKLNPSEEETLLMMAKPACEMAPGQYRIIITSLYTGACEDVCGQYCEFTEEDDVVLTVPKTCLAPTEPEVTEPPEPEQNLTENTTEQNRTETPTGAAVSAENDHLSIGILFILLGIFIIFLALIQRDSKGNKKQIKGEKK
jgi:hypothetical protein